MKILFLGTGAADWPLERQDGMTEFRRLSSALVDDILLIDPGPQVLGALSAYGKDPAAVRYIINTHRHGDHYCADTVSALQQSGAAFVEFAAGEEKQVGPYTVSAYAGNHATCAGTVHFIIRDGERTLFYGLDGAWLLYDEVQAIKAFQPDLAVLDATIGDIDGDYRIFEHNNLQMVMEMQKTLQPFVKQFCISHMAMTLHTDHRTLAERMKIKQIITAFDGLEMEV